MIEPTETESIETLDAAIQMLQDVIEQADTEPEILKNAPVATPIGRPDEVAAARRPILKFLFESEE
jgi:glycine dehydrogenase subunit 2